MKLGELRVITQTISNSARPSDQQSVFELLQKNGIEPGNFYQELEMSSRFVDTHQDISFSNSSVQLHSHPFYEIIYCRNSCGAEYLVGSNRYRLQKGDIIIVAPGISHRPLLPENLPEPYSRDILWLSTEYFNMLMNIAPQELFRVTGTQLLRTAGTRWEYLGDLFHTGVMEFERHEIGWEAAVLGNTTELIVHLHRAILAKETKPLKAEKPDLLDQVMAYVESHLAEKITLTDIANHFYVSESTISQNFRKRMNVSFYRCVTQRRLISAKTMIVDGYPLETVAERVGFSDYSSFYRAFRQEYGISPRQYRKIQENTEK